MTVVRDRIKIAAQIEVNRQYHSTARSKVECVEVSSNF